MERVAAIVRAMKEFAHPDSVEHSRRGPEPRDRDDADWSRTTNTSTPPRSRPASASCPLVHCNIGELNQVFLNLIVNAAHAIAESGKDDGHRPDHHHDATVGEHVRSRSRTTAAAFPQENLEKIFDPFFTTKPVGKGTGQGLAIARSIIVEKHGGRIDVHSDVGSGTRFMLRLPIARPCDREGRAMKRLLFVDDEQSGAGWAALTPAPLRRRTVADGVRHQRRARHRAAATAALRRHRDGHAHAGDGRRRAAGARQQRWPQTVRIVLSGYAELEQTIRLVPVSPTST